MPQDATTRRKPPMGLEAAGRRRERTERNGVMAAGYVDTNGVRLWYEELGRPDGAPVMLAMGAERRWSGGHPS